MTIIRFVPRARKRSSETSRRWEPRGSRAANVICIGATLIAAILIAILEFNGAGVEALARRWGAGAVTGRFEIAFGGRVFAGRVVDGDTLSAGDTRLRLHAIDAPEIGQPCLRAGASIDCGRLSARALAEIVGGWRVTCHDLGGDRYGRRLASCTRSDGSDIDGLMVASGWALAYRRYASDHVAEEDEARRWRRGMWSAEFIQPETWRHTAH